MHAGSTTTSPLRRRAERTACLRPARSRTQPSKTSTPPAARLDGAVVQQPMDFPGMAHELGIEFHGGASGYAWAHLVRQGRELVSGRQHALQVAERLDRRIAQPVVIDEPDGSCTLQDMAVHCGPVVQPIVRRGRGKTLTHVMAGKAKGPVPRTELE